MWCVRKAQQSFPSQVGWVQLLPENAGRLFQSKPFSQCCAVWWKTVGEASSAAPEPRALQCLVLITVGDYFTSVADCV